MHTAVETVHRFPLSPPLPSPRSGAGGGGGGGEQRFSLLCACSCGSCPGVGGCAGWTTLRSGCSDDSSVEAAPASACPPAQPSRTPIFSPRRSLGGKKNQRTAPTKIPQTKQQEGECSQLLFLHMRYRNVGRSPRASFPEETARLICFSFCITTTAHLQETSDAQN